MSFMSSNVVETRQTDIGSSSHEGGEQRGSSTRGADSRSNLLASRQISIQPIVIKPNAVARSISVSSTGDSPHLSPTIQMNDYKDLLGASNAATALPTRGASPATSPLPQGSATSVNILTLLAPNASSSTASAASATDSGSSSTTLQTTSASASQDSSAIAAQPSRHDSVSRSESLPVSQPVQRVDSLAQPFMQPPRPIEVPSDCKKFIEVGKYILFDSNVNNDTLNTAYCTENHLFYTWKKFTKQDYKKKLEPYFIMEGCSEHVYKISEILTDHNSSSADKNAVYVMFDAYYGDLHTYMKEKKRLGESEARHIFRQCVQAVQQCHENGIIVRDIKLKKFIFTNPERTQIALTNLEDCLVLDEDAPNDLIRSQQGCPAYVSPEVLNSQQTPYSGMLSDSWSLGIVLYTLLFGRYPFHHQIITNMFARIARAKFQIPPSSGLSADAKTLLRSLIRLKPSERLRPFEILAHNWFKQVDDEFNYNLSHNSLSRHSSAAANLDAKSHPSAWMVSGANLPSTSNFLNVFNAHKPLGASLSAPNRLLNDSRRNQTKQKQSRPAEEDDSCVVPVFESATEASN